MARAGTPQRSVNGKITSNISIKEAAQTPGGAP
jgi:hypothetical protein